MCGLESGTPGMRDHSRAPCVSSHALPPLPLPVQPAINYNTSKNISPLGVAAKYGRLHVIEALLSRGADINFRSHLDGTTALMAAARAGQTQSVVMLCERRANVLIKVRVCLRARAVALQLPAPPP